ncbi:MAG TPA: amidohydrolase family protein, partial [Acidimicrobiales bacterium]|nr:amidohydrolase family protein [Acidimicrobiales bacterium]
MTTRIRGGTVVDGTGGPPRQADVLIADGRIAEIGGHAGEAPADTVIDATDMLVTPGFIDLHTHYDAQLFWDPNASPSPLHGVTTVLGGNCGFSLAPCGPDHVDYLSRMMARVEGMPLAALQQGLAWDWASFGQWLGQLQGRLAVNAGFLVGHSTLRRLVMGERAVGGAATDADSAAMVSALHAALGEGALGFSTSQVHTHNDGDGQPVPSRAATRSELELLAAAVREHDGTTVELIIAGCLNGFTEDDIDLMSSISLLADRPINWNVLGVSAMNPDGLWDQLAASTAAAARGATVVALTLPHTMQLRLSFEHGAILDGLPGWREVFMLAVPERMKALSDPETRRRLDAGAQSDEAGILRHLAVWERLILEETFAEENARYEGHTVGEVARQRGVAPFDALLDVVVADELRTGLRPPIPESEEDWALRAEAWVDPRAVVGGSDAGAHLDTMCGAIYSTSLLGDGVRQRSLLSWEEAVRQLTDIPARLYGLRDRGRLVPGAWADVVVLDPTAIGHGPVRTRKDLPGGASRLYAEAVGIAHVLVNGTEIVREGSFTEARPGTLLRSGTDT